MMDDCLFCKIIKRDIIADVVAETASAYAFRDINPQAKTHVLIIPKQHIASTRELNKQNMYTFVFDNKFVISGAYNLRLTSANGDADVMVSYIDQDWT